MLCGTSESRRNLLKKSIFALILTDSKHNKFDGVFQRITEALESGAIPVFLCLPSCYEIKNYLPFKEVIDWSKFSIFWPAAKVTEIHFLLRSFQDKDLFKMKDQGRKIWMHYLGSGQAIMSTVFNLIRTRVGLPAAPTIGELTKR